MIRVLVVDDHPAMRDAVSRALERDPRIEVVGQAGNGEDAARLMVSSEPDVVVCDIQLGGDADGLRLLERVVRPGGPAFLMLSAFDYATLFRTAFERGAAGYLLKTVELADVVSAVHVVAGGGTAFSAASMRVIRAAPRRPSQRELDVLGLVASGATNEEIAAQLVVSLKTIESHLRRLFDRYGVMNRTELAVLGLREGWIPTSTG